MAVMKMMIRNWGLSGWTGRRRGNSLTSCQGFWEWIKAKMEMMRRSILRLVQRPYYVESSFSSLFEAPDDDGVSIEADFLLDFLADSPKESLESTAGDGIEKGPPLRIKHPPFTLEHTEF